MGGATALVAGSQVNPPCIEIVSLRMGSPSACSRQEARAFRPEAVSRQHLRPIHSIFNRSADGAPAETEGPSSRCSRESKKFREWRGRAPKNRNRLRLTLIAIRDVTRSSHWAHLSESRPQGIHVSRN